MENLNEQLKKLLKNFLDPKVNNEQLKPIARTILEELEAGQKIDVVKLRIVDLKTQVVLEDKEPTGLQGLARIKALEKLGSDIFYNELYDFSSEQQNSLTIENYSVKVLKRRK